MMLVSECCGLIACPDDASIGHGSERIIISLGSWETANRNPEGG